MPNPSIIAIDGSAASGKSTLGLRLAEFLGYLYFDTGVMYRAVTWAALCSGNINIDDEEAVTALADQIKIDIQPASKDDGRQYDVFVDGRDVTWEIRHPLVDGNVSPVSAYAGVRKALTEKQRRIGLRGNVVMVGRDIGTVVLPEATLKIYLDASLEERARRRYNEIIQRGGKIEFDQVIETIRRRDQIDSSRAVAPLRPAEDAVILDTEGLTIEDVFDKAKSLIAL